MAKLVDTYVTTGDLEGTFYVMGSDARGGEYMLNHAFTKLAAAEKVINNIKAAGSVINEDLWSYRPTYGSASWDDAGMEEATIFAERFQGLGEANTYDYNQEAYGPTAECGG